MDVVVERCAGLDVHRDSVVATVRLPGNGKSRRRREQQTRSFGTTIGQLEQLADWLQGLGVTLVARARPARPPPPRRAPHPPPPQTTRSTRQQGHPPGRRPNTRPDDIRTTPPPNPPSNPLTRGPIRPSTPPAFTPQERVDGSSPSEGLVDLQVFLLQTATPTTPRKSLREL